MTEDPARTGDTNPVPISVDLNNVARTGARELLADVSLKCARGSTYASRFVARAEIMCALQGDGLGRMAADEKDRDGNTGGILVILISSFEGYAFDARVIRGVLVVLGRGTGLELPPASRVFNIGERLAGELQSKRHREFCSPMG